MDDTPSFFQILDEHFDLNEFIPSVFTNAFFQHLGRKKDLSLNRIFIRPHSPKDFFYPNGLFAHPLSFPV